VKRVFEIGELLPKAVILDGNGNPLKPNDFDTAYYNRFQSSIPHLIVRCNLKAKVLKTIGGYEYVRPFAYCDISYYDEKRKVRHTNRGCQFEAVFVKEGMYAFPQLIPLKEDPAFDYAYCSDRSFVEALKKHLHIDEEEKK